jgi:hypothetical protein
MVVYDHRLNVTPFPPEIIPKAAPGFQNNYILKSKI